MESTHLRNGIAIARLFAAPLAALFVTTTLLAAAPPDDKDASPPAKKDAPAGGKGSKAKAPADAAKLAKMQLKLEKDDREALDRNVNYTLVEPPGEVEWVGSSPMSLQTLQGRVVVIQSISTRNSNWKSTVEPLRRQFQTMETDPPVLLLLHTPEGAERAKPILEPALAGAIAVIDEEGVWCDDLGVWKRPVNLVVDRNGVVRFAGLTNDGVVAAVELLRQETADPNAEPKPRPAATNEAAKFPTFRETVGAVDRRGSAIPGFAVDSWVNGTPDRGDRLLVVDFWATWCGPCRAMIPHMNELADKYSADACVVGISDESKSNFDEGSRKHKLKERDFRYSLALDPQKRLIGFFQPKGIPHCVIISSDNIVRWQGHPSQLNAEVMDALVTANRALKAGGSGSGGKWKAAASKSGGSGGSRAPKRKSY